MKIKKIIADRQPLSDSWNEDGISCYFKTDTGGFYATVPARELYHSYNYFPDVEIKYGDGKLSTFKKLKEELTVPDCEMVEEYIPAENKVQFGC